MCRTGIHLLRKLSISLPPQQELCSDKRALVKGVWVSAAPRYIHIHTYVFFHYFACFLPLIVFNQTEGKGQRQLGSKKKEKSKATIEEERNKKSC